MGSSEVRVRSRHGHRVDILLIFYPLSVLTTSGTSRNRGHCSAAITPFSIERDSTGLRCARQKCLRPGELGDARFLRYCSPCSTSGTDGSSKLQRRSEYGPRISNPNRNPRNCSSCRHPRTQRAHGELWQDVPERGCILRHPLRRTSCSSRFRGVEGDARSFKGVLLHSHWTHFDLTMVAQMRTRWGLRNHTGVKRMGDANLIYSKRTV
jgi:hypothetical protein